MSVNHIVSPSGNIVAIIGTKHFQIPANHPSYKEVVEALNSKDGQKVISLLDIKEAVKVKSQGKIRIEGDTVYFGDEVIRGNLPERIIEMLHKNQPVEAMCKFLENLMENPSNHSVECVYAFLEKKGFPLTEDGCFLGYKSVNSEFKDWYSGKFDNSVGQVLEIRRNTVDENWQVQCSSGFHVGTFDYAQGFHNCNGRHIMIVKVNPRDVVSVPDDAYADKIRVCKYEVVGELESSTILPENLYSSAPRDPQPVVGGQFDNPTSGSTWDGDHTSYEDDDDDYYDDDDDSEIEDYSDDEDDDEDEEVASSSSDFGVKPNGHRFHNRRGPGGQFISRN